MASSSLCTWKYNVFTSFHGPDVRKGFLSHLQKQFKANGITMFDDQGIERSQLIAPALTGAIRESRISIVVLSKNYASSSWCLDELLEILKCKEDARQIVMTVFYEVDPSDVRKQMGHFGNAFIETCARKTEEERRKKWSQALTYVGNIAGEDFKNWDNESNMIEKIARDVSDKLNVTPSRDFDGMVGLEAHLKTVESLLDIDNNGVKIVGISGPAGIGKSTIARALHGRHSNSFTLNCFMDNLRGSSHGGSDEYSLKLCLEEQLLSKILKLNGVTIHHLGVIKDRLHDQKVLIILDDVKSLDQLEALANIGWFGPGSRVIVTTENKEILQQHGISNIYDIQPLANLKRMNLSYSSRLKELPDLSNATNLEILNLSNCTALVELPSSFVNLHKVCKFKISGCKSLQVIPTLANMKSLEEIYIRDCSRLISFPDIPTNITSLVVAVTMIEEVPASIVHCSRIEYIDISGSVNVKSLLTDLPKSVKFLYLNESCIERITDCIKDLHNLENLELSSCKRLVSLPELPSSLKYLNADNCESLERVSGPLNTPNASLHFSNCFKLDGEARRTIIQEWLVNGYAILPGRQVPPDFNHRARGNSLTILNSAFYRFKVCVVIVPYDSYEYTYQDENSDDDKYQVLKPLSDSIQVDIKVPFFLDPEGLESEHLVIFHLSLSFIDPSKVRRKTVLLFSDEYNGFNVIECGIKILRDETNNNGGSVNEDDGCDLSVTHESVEESEKEVASDKEHYGSESISRKRKREMTYDQSDEASEEENYESDTMMIKNLIWGIKRLRL